MTYFPSATGATPPNTQFTMDAGGNIVATAPALTPSFWDQITGAVSDAVTGVKALVGAAAQPAAQAPAARSSIPWVPIAAVGGAAVLAVMLFKKGRRRR